jgi:hypothetical protein
VRKQDFCLLRKNEVGSTRNLVVLCFYRISRNRGQWVPFGDPPLLGISIGLDIIGQVQNEDDNILKSQRDPKRSPRWRANAAMCASRSVPSTGSEVNRPTHADSFCPLIPIQSVHASKSAHVETSREGFTTVLLIVKAMEIWPNADRPKDFGGE